MGWYWWIENSIGPVTFLPRPSKYPNDAPGHSVSNTLVGILLLFTITPSGGCTNQETLFDETKLPVFTKLFSTLCTTL